MKASKTNKDKLFRLMAIWGEMTPGERPSADKMEGYYKIACSCSFSFEKIEKNGSFELKHTGFFPKTTIFNDEKNLEMRAQEDYILLDDLCQQFVFDGFGECGYNIIKMKLKEAGKGYLFEVANRFGYEMTYGTNPTATRAQVIKQIKFINHVQRKQLSGQEKKQIGKVDKLLDNVTKRI